jgi:hypothetical protein
MYAPVSRTLTTLRAAVLNAVYARVHVPMNARAMFGTTRGRTCYPQTTELRYGNTQLVPHVLSICICAPASKRHQMYICFLVSAHMLYSRARTCIVRSPVTIEDEVLHADARFLAAMRFLAANKLYILVDNHLQNDATVRPGRSSTVTPNSAVTS